MGLLGKLFLNTRIISLMRKLLTLCSFCLLTFGQEMTMTVADLCAFVKSEIAGKVHTDRVIAAKVAAIQLKEKLSDPRIEELEAAGAGPSTAAALRVQRDKTKDLPLPAK